MTTARRHGNDTDFGAWLRQNHELDSRRGRYSVQNLDYILHRYGFTTERGRVERVMVIEEKTRGGKQSYAQRDTHSIVAQALALAAGKIVRTARGEEAVFEWWGYHLLTFENTSPADGKMWWDNEPIDERRLVFLLKMGLP